MAPEYCIQLVIGKGLDVPGVGAFRLPVVDVWSILPRLQPHSNAFRAISKAFLAEAARFFSSRAR